MRSNAPLDLDAVARLMVMGQTIPDISKHMNVSATELTAAVNGQPFLDRLDEIRRGVDRSMDAAICGLVGRAFGRCRDVMDMELVDGPTAKVVLEASKFIIELAHANYGRRSEQIVAEGQRNGNVYVLADRAELAREAAKRGL